MAFFDRGSCLSPASPLFGFLLLPCLLGFLACGSGARSARNPDGREASTVPPQLPADRVQVIEEAERPLLQLVRRMGDPHGAVALAAFPDGGSRGAIALGVLLERRLRKHGLRGVELRPHAFGFVLVAPAHSSEAGAKLLRAFRTVLAQPVAANEPALPFARSWLEHNRRRARASAAGFCAGELGTEGSGSHEPLSAQQLEGFRRSAFARTRVGLAALGTEELLAAVRAAHDESWPEAPAPRQPWPSADEVKIVSDNKGRSLRLAWYLPDPTRALTVAHALSDLQHPLRHRLAALGRFRLSHATATVRPRGACLGVDLTPEGTADRPDVEELAEATTVVSLEVERALQGASEDQPHQRTLLAPSDPLVAAALAAWTAVRATEPPGAPRRIVEYAAPAVERRPSAQALAERIDKITRLWQGRTLPVRTQSEEGQAETWILVASPCGTRGEPEQDAGTLALAVHSLARGFQGNGGVSLEPWATSDGVGLLAHAARRADETPEAQAERIARAVGRALAGDPLDGRAVADARSGLLDRLGADTGWWLAVETLSGDFPSALEPLGTWKALSTTSTSAVERARASLAKGPLRLAVLADHDPRQGATAAAALSDWLAPFRDEGALCLEPKIKPPNPGQWTLETIDEEVREGVYVSVWAEGPRELGLATTYLLNRPGGLLDQALEEPELVSSAQAHWLGGGPTGALVIEIGAEPGQLDAAVHQTRALLDRLAQGALDAKDAALARAEQVRREATLRLSPRGRIVELWHERAQVPVTRASLRKFHEALSADRHLVVLVKRRR